MSAIRTRGLRRVFGEVVAVEALDLEVRVGEIFGLVGPDGAGKTTTMRLLAGVLAPSAGTAEVAGCDVGRDPEGVKGHIGYMSQRFGLYPDLTVRENLDFYADIYGVGRRERTPRLERLLQFSNLAPFQRRFAGDLSGGMKQKLGLACALIHTPRVLLLDEPTNGVDPVSRRDFWRILYQLLRDGVTIFVSTSYLDEAERCNRLVLLHAGRVLGAGTPDEVRQLLPGSTWEVVVDRPRPAAAWVRASRRNVTVAVYGDRLHLTGSDVDEMILRDQLNGEGFAVRSLRQVKPSLEDVFVGVLANRQKASA